MEMDWSSSLLCLLLPLLSLGAIVHSAGFLRICSANPLRWTLLSRRVPLACQHRPHTANSSSSAPLPKAESVNFHFTRQCNYKCGFCFHTAKTSYLLPLDEAKRGLKLLREYGTEKINFSGGEPFLIAGGRHLGEMVRFAKEECKFPSVTIVSNGSKIKAEWFFEFGEFLDILAISCDSFDEETNRKIGRYEGSKSHIAQLHHIRSWCTQHGVQFKINTVVNSANHLEDMTKEILKLNPVRWKVFQCLLIEGENLQTASAKALRDATDLVVSSDEFEAFCARHRAAVGSLLVPESNEKMRDSYLILDEQMRFLDCTQGKKEPSKSILDVGVGVALGAAGFDEKMFYERGGKYKWSRERGGGAVDIEDL